MKICIFGAGQAGRMASVCRAGGINLLCFIDNNPAVQQKMRYGYPVCSLDDALKQEPDEIWIAVLNWEAEQAIETQIRNAGYKKTVRKLSDVRGLADTRLASMRLYAEEIYRKKIPGAVAELGVYRGDFAVELQKAFPDRKLYLFDTFSGFPEEAVKTEQEQGYSRTVRQHFSDTSEALVLERLGYAEQVICRPGIFPDTATGLEETFAFVNIDPDLYEPTLAGISYFYPRMSRGGCIFIHDYNSFQFTGVRAAVTKYCDEHQIFVFPVTDMHGTAVIIKP